MKLLSYTIIDFHLCYDGAVDIQIWAPLTRSQCKVSDTQVTVKACGPLVLSFHRLLYTDKVKQNICWQINLAATSLTNPPHFREDKNSLKIKKLSNFHWIDSLGDSNIGAD